jgi:hypothetical protein
MDLPLSVLRVLLACTPTKANAHPPAPPPSSTESALVFVPTAVSSVELPARNVALPVPPALPSTPAPAARAPSSTTRAPVWHHVPPTPSLLPASASTATPTAQAAPAQPLLASTVCLALSDWPKDVTGTVPFPTTLTWPLSPARNATLTARPAVDLDDALPASMTPHPSAVSALLIAELTALNAQLVHAPSALPASSGTEKAASNSALRLLLPSTESVCAPVASSSTLALVSLPVLLLSSTSTTNARAASPLAVSAPLRPALATPALMDTPSTLSTRNAQSNPTATSASTPPTSETADTSVPKAPITLTLPATSEDAQLATPPTTVTASAWPPLFPLAATTHFSSRAPTVWPSVSPASTLTRPPVSAHPAHPTVLPALVPPPVLLAHPAPPSPTTSA